ncbi:MAG: hypothetical protein M3376_06750 [Actinomycetota bacterium]|nr:hypothetical protein [Actinomycetota bacterium]
MATRCLGLRALCPQDRQHDLQLDIAAVELASFLVFDAKRFDVSRDDVISDFRSLYGDRFDETALQLALIGAFVQLGCHFALPIALGGADQARATASAELHWWTPKVAARSRHGRRSEPPAPRL